MSASIPWAYAYTGGNAYAYTGGNAYAYSAPLEAYGFDGFPGNPMLYASLQATRGAIRKDFFSAGVGGANDIGQTRRWGGNTTSLPPLDTAAAIGRYGAQVRNSMALMELMSSVAFAFDNNDPHRAVLWGQCVPAAGSAVMLSELVAMKRPSRAFFEAQLKNVDDWTPSRDGRMAEVLTQVAPPLACFASVMNLQGGRHRKTLEFINVALQFGYAVCMRFKHALACPRPSEYTAGLLPVIEVPMHPALPAGHASEAHITSRLLCALAGLSHTSQPALALRRLAHRIAENRVVAGLHFPIDNVAGRLLGDCLSDYILAVAGCPGMGSWIGGDFDGANLDPAQANAYQLVDRDSGVDARETGLPCRAFNRALAAPASPVLQQMWADALAEWTV